MKAVLLTCGIGSWYPSGIKRLTDSFNMKGWLYDIKAWVNELPPDARPHSQVPYDFKPKAFKWAEQSGYDVAIWCDAAVWANGNPNDLVDIVAHQGHLFLRNGWTTGEWLADSALDSFGLTREQSFRYPHMMACVMGLDLNKGVSKDFLNQWNEVSTKAFPGAWSNKRMECSKDARVLGHRHDQSAASIISVDLNMKWNDTTGIISYDVTDTSNILLSQGM